MPFVRFAVAPYYPDDLALWRNDPERFWRQGMDVAVAMAHTHNVRLVPDLLWNCFAFAGP